MAKAQAHQARSMPRLVFFVSVAAISLAAALAKVDAQGPPSKIELYNLLAGSAVVAASPSGNGTGSGGGFGTITVFNAISRAGPGEESAQIGQIAGQAITIVDDIRFVTVTYMLNITGYAGSISSQGVTNANKGGQTAIIGGTGDFLSVTGYVEAVVVTPRVLDKFVFYIEYP